MARYESSGGSTKTSASGDQPQDDGDVSYDGQPVGYKHPPKKHQFQKNQPKPPGSGRKAGQKNTKSIIEDLLDRSMTITENGRQRRVSTREALLMKALNTALTSGKIADQKRFFDLVKDLNPSAVVPPLPIPIASFPVDDTV